MANHELTRSQHNQVTLAIVAATLDVSEFEWGEVTSTIVHPDGVIHVGRGSRPPYTVEAVSHRPTDYSFVFDLDPDRGHHYAIFKPGPEGPTFSINAGPWERELTYVIEWLANVKREHEAPDFWAEALHDRELVVDQQPGADVDNSLFTPEERAAPVGVLW